MNAAWGDPALRIVGFAAPVTRRRRRRRRLRRWMSEAAVAAAYAVAALALAAPPSGGTPVLRTASAVSATAALFPGASPG